MANNYILDEFGKSSNVIKYRDLFILHKKYFKTEFINYFKKLNFIKINHNKFTEFLDPNTNLRIIIINIKNPSYEIANIAIEIYGGHVKNWDVCNYIMSSFKYEKSYLYYLESLFKILQKNLRNIDKYKPKNKPWDFIYSLTLRYSPILKNIVGKSVLDVGTSSGILPLLIKKNMPSIKVVASDIKNLGTPKLLAKKNNIDVIFRVLNILNIKDVNEKYDTVICSHVLEHFPEKMNEKIIYGLLQLTKKSLIVSVPMGNEFQEDHKQQFDKTKIVTLGLKFCKNIIIKQAKKSEGMIIIMPKKYMRNKIIIPKVPDIEYIKLKLTDKCNLDCIMCDIPRVKGKKELTTDEMKKLIDDAYNIGAKRVHTTGGEPLLRTDLFELIKYAKSKSMDFDIQTNGTLINKNIAKQLAEVGIKEMAVTIQGPKKIDELIRGKGTFYKTIEAIKHLQKNNIKISIVAAILRQNYLYLKDLLKIALDLDIKSVRFQPYMESLVFEKDKKKPMILPNEVSKLKKEIQRLIILARRYDIDIGPTEYLLNIPNYFSGDFKAKPNPNCSFPFKCCVISSDGNVYPCYNLFSQKIGNLREKPLSELWSSDKFREVREMIRGGKCPGCLLSCYDKIFKNNEVVIPKRINFGDVCNNNCTNCDSLKIKSSFQKSTIQIKQELLGLVNSNMTDIILPCNSDMRDDITSIIDYAKSIGFRRITLESNGRMFSYNDFSQKFVKSGIKNFHIILCGHNSKMHDSITGVVGSFEQAMFGIRNLLNLKQNVRIKLVNKMNYKNLNKILKLSENMGIKSVILHKNIINGDNTKLLIKKYPSLTIENSKI